MKEFIEYLKKSGKFDRMVYALKSTKEVVEELSFEDVKGGIAKCISFERSLSEEFADKFAESACDIAIESIAKEVMNQIEESEKVEALNDFDYDSFFEKVFGKEDKNEAVDKFNEVVEEFSEAVDELIDELIDKLNEIFGKEGK